MMPMGQREELVAIARSQIGYQEGPNNTTKYGAWYGMNFQPWCDIFISWCAGQADLLTIIPKNAYVPNRMAYYQAKGAFRPWGAYTPRPGDLVLFDFNANGTADHDGIVAEVHGNILYSIEGNTTPNGESGNGGGVYLKNRSLNSNRIVGYCLPAYKEDDAMNIKTIEVLNLDSNKLIAVEAVNIEGSNYVKLRDTEKLFPVTIGWDGQNPTLKFNYNE